MEAVSIIMGLLRVVGNDANKKISLKIENNEKIAILPVSALNAISCLISKALSDDSNSEEGYSLILLEFETFTRMKEDRRIKPKTSLEKLVILKLKLMICFVEIRLVFRFEFMFKTMFRIMLKPYSNDVQNQVQNHVQNHVQIMFKTMFKIMSKIMFKIMFEI